MLTTRRSLFTTQSVPEPSTWNSGYYNRELASAGAVMERQPRPTRTREFCPVFCMLLAAGRYKPQTRTKCPCFPTRVLWGRRKQHNWR